MSCNLMMSVYLDSTTKRRHERIKNKKNRLGRRREERREKSGMYNRLPAKSNNIDLRNYIQFK